MGENGPGNQEFWKKNGSEPWHTHTASLGYIQKVHTNIADMVVIYDS